MQVEMDSLRKQLASEANVAEVTIAGLRKSLSDAEHEVEQLRDSTCDGCVAWLALLLAASMLYCWTGLAKTATSHGDAVRSISKEQGEVTR